jgi:hypothetical protein
MKQKTAMQDLKDDLIETIKTSKEALEDLQNKELAQEIHLYVEATLRMIIQRLDNELLKTEKEQIEKSFNEGWLQCNIDGLPEKSRKHFKTADEYFDFTYTQSSE